MLYLTEPWLSNVGWVFVFGIQPLTDSVEVENESLSRLRLGLNKYISPERFVIVCSFVKL